MVFRTLTTLLLSTLIIFTLSGCVGNQPCKPKIKRVCTLPKLPTFKVPASKKFTVKPIDSNKSIIKNDILLELVRNNTKLRNTCYKYMLINKKINEEYSNEKDSYSSRTH